MGSDSSVSLSESKFDYGVDGHTFEPIRSDDTAGHVSHADDGTGYEEVVVVVARRSFHKKSYDYDTHLGHLHPLGETPPMPSYASKL